MKFPFVQSGWYPFKYTHSFRHTSKWWRIQLHSNASTLTPLSLKTTSILTNLIIFLSLIATSTGIFLGNLYQDNAFVKTAWYANDWVTLIFVIPALVVFRFIAVRSSVKAQIIWMGLLGFMVYNYAFYLFRAAFNKVFLVYVAIFTLSLFAFITGLRAVAAQSFTFKSKGLRWISLYLFHLSLVLILVEVVPAVKYIFNGEIPKIITATHHPTSIVYALDLSLIVPTLVLAGVLLWQYQPWGFLLSAIMLVKGITYGLVLCAGTILQTLNKINQDPLLPFYFFITAGGLVGLTVLMRNMTPYSNKL